jgi:hypothetical protein
MATTKQSGRGGKDPTLETGVRKPGPKAFRVTVFKPLVGGKTVRGCMPSKEDIDYAISFVVAVEVQQGVLRQMRKEHLKVLCTALEVLEKSGTEEEALSEAKDILTRMVQNKDVSSDERFEFAKTLRELCGIRKL